MIINSFIHSQKFIKNDADHKSCKKKVITLLQIPVQNATSIRCCDHLAFLHKSQHARCQYMHYAWCWFCLPDLYSLASFK